MPEIITPGRLHVGCQFVEADNAQQHVTQLANGGQVQLFVVGGLSKREEIAKHVVGHLAAAAIADPQLARWSPLQFAQAMGAQALAIADAILGQTGKESHEQGATDDEIET